MKARLIKREQTTKQSNSQEMMRQNSHIQLEAQAPSLIGITAILAEVAARMTTPERRRREQAREHFNNLFAQRP